MRPTNAPTLAPVVIAVASAIFGCVDLTPKPGTLECAGHSDCPSGWYCASDLFCYPTGTDGGPGACDSRQDGAACPEICASDRGGETDTGTGTGPNRDTGSETETDSATGSDAGSDTERDAAAGAPPDSGTDAPPDTGTEMSDAGGDPDPDGGAEAAADGSAAFND
jgi:hypothetical protein